MANEKLAALLEKNEIKGVIAVLDDAGGVAFSKNCDIMSLMILKAFIDYNIDQAIDEAVNASGKKESPKLNIPTKKS